MKDKVFKVNLMDETSDECGWTDRQSDARLLCRVHCGLRRIRAYSIRHEANSYECPEEEVMNQRFFGDHSELD